MAVTVVEDTIQGASLSETASEINVERRFIVSGVTGSRTERLDEAKENSKIPRMGDVHPDIPQARVYQKDVEPLDNENFAVTVGYRPYSAADAQVGELAQIEIGASLYSVQANVDVDGEVMFVEDPRDPAKKQGVMVDLQLPTKTIRATKRISYSPWTEADNWVGAINSNILNIGGITVSAKLALCTGITGRSIDGGNIWEVTYEFQVARPGPEFDPWNPVVYATDEVTGKPYAEKPDGSPLEEGKHFKKFDMYPLRMMGPI